MTQPTFQKATKKRSKARVAIDGPSGAGKTFTALVAAGVLAQGGRVAVIDTERGSASLYSDRFDFDVLELNNFNPQNYINAIDAAERAGYAVIVIDSLSHAWEGEGGALDMVDQATKRSQSGNNYTAWKNVTPLQRKLVDAMLQSPCHIVATMRSKTEYVLETNERGKQVPRKVGMAPVQRQGMEYEFTVVGDMDIDHNLAVTKSRCEVLADKVVLKPDARFWQTFVDWLNSGADAPPPQRAAATPPPTEREYSESEIGPDFDAPPHEESEPPTAPAKKPGPGMWKTWREIAAEADGLGIPLPTINADAVSDQELALAGKTLRDQVVAAKAKAQAAARAPASTTPNGAGQAGSKPKPTRDELFARVKELGEEAKKLNLVGLSWTANPRWTEDQIIRAGKELRQLIDKKPKEPAHA